MNQDDIAQDHALNSQTPTGTGGVPPITPPTEGSSALPPTPPPAPKESKSKTLIIALLAVVLLLAVGAAVYFLALAPEETTTADDTDSSISEAPKDVFSPAELVISDIAGAIAGEQQEVSKIDAYGGTGADNRIVYSTASYRSGEQKFAVYPEIAYGLGTSSTAEVAASDFATITSHLTENNFNELGEDTSVYASDDTVCAVQLLTAATYSRDGIGVGCANVSDYTKSYETALPFFETYAEATSESTDNLLISPPQINDGIDGHKRAHVSISTVDAAGGFAGLFYRTSDTADWQYFTSTQSDLLCSAFNTAALQKAFSGEVCYEDDATEPSSVKLVE